MSDGQFVSGDILYLETDEQKASEALGKRRSNKAKKPLMMFRMMSKMEYEPNLEESLEIDFETYHRPARQPKNQFSTKTDKGKNYLNNEFRSYIPLPRSKNRRRGGVILEEPKVSSLEYLADGK